jgi:5-methylcytosine-specific restriction protein A
MTRYCIVPGCPVLITAGSRCAQHRAEQRAKYGGAWQAISRAAIREHRAEHGDWCPGWRTDPHPATDLVLDHQVGVLCRSCNTRKQNVGDG